MSKINKIRLSGTDYDIQDVSATSVVELTQAEYDDLPASAKTDNILYIITDSTVDYVTSAQTQSAITQAVSGKVDTATYTAYTAATDTALANKQTTLTAGTGIAITNNVISTTGGGNSVVELTQAAYDALVTGGTVDPDTFYIITDAQAGDLTNYYTKTETDNAITAATSTKQDQLVSGTNIKTINNESILGSGNIDIQGGGGKAVTGGTNISVTTGETADTINCTLNLENGTNSQSGGLKLKSFVAGNEVRGRDACAFGGSNRANGTNSFVTGYRNTGNTTSAFVSGNRNQTTNDHEILFGSVALSNGSHTGDLNGYSDATLLAVGNGNVATQTRHNAFEIRQNGDIYIADTNDTSTTNWYEKPMIKLQDQLGGGGGGTVESAITSGSTNAVESKAIWSATTFNKDVLLTFNGIYSTNYPNGCTKLKVEVTGGGVSTINFYNDNQNLGIIDITNFGSIAVYNSFNGATYEISGTTVIINYPTVTNVTRIEVSSNADYVYTAVVEGAWVNENTYMKPEVDSIATSLQNNINSKQDTLVSGTNIKTINNESILGEGNIDIQGGGSSYTAGDGIDITNNVISVTGKVDTTTYETYTAATDTAIAGKQDILTGGNGIDINNDVISVTGKADTSAVTAIQDSLSGYVTTDTEQIISGRKIFTYSATSSKAIEFKQTSDTAKVGFRVTNSTETNNELASFEFRPNTFKVDGVQHPLLYFGHYRNTNTAAAGIQQTYIGFRQYDQPNAAAYHYLIPLPEKAKTPFNLTTSFKDYYAPMGFKNGSTMITADDTGVVDLSSELGGLKLVKLTQAEYDALSPNYDSNTLYVING